MLNNIRIVLLNTTHPGNIGAAARAMKTMGLSRLYLVNPCATFPSAEVTARAAGADSVLENARIFDRLEEAIADCHVIIGSSAEERSLPLQPLSARDCAEWALAFPPSHEIALVFGTERLGMSNHELSLCQRQIVIPTNSEYSSLNLAQAVQVVSYELWVAASLGRSSTPFQYEEYDKKATSEQMLKFYEHLEQTLIDLEFLKPGVEKKLIPRLKRLFNRACLEENEINILRGILNASQQKKKTP